MRETGLACGYGLRVRDSSAPEQPGRIPGIAIRTEQLTRNAVPEDEK